MSPDDIKRGQWIVITGITRGDGTSLFEGVPMRVEAVSYPFIAAKPIPGILPAECKFPDVLRLHVGNFTFAKVNAAYRRAIGQKQDKASATADAKDPLACPTCGGKTRCKRSIETGQWEWVCGTCQTVVTPPASNAAVQ